APCLVQTRLRKIQGTGMSGRLFVSAGVILSDVGIRRLAIGIVLSAGAWFTYTLLAWQLGLALGIGLPWNTMAMVATLASMISTVPVSVQGLGVRESVFLLLLGSMGIDYEITIAFSLLLMAMSLVPSVWGLVSWQRDPFVRIGPEKLEEAIVEPIELVHERD
ncbi:MAG: lysylphosphatidylglycerol synthase domain-containing protein, partial [Candidatus Thorarchaeota archaeon]